MARSSSVSRRTRSIVAKEAKSSKSVLNLDAFSLSMTKVFMQLIISGINLFCWIVPLHYEGVTGNKKILSIASCYSGGIFLALSITHLLPHAAEEMESVGEDPKGKYGAYMCALMGYLLVLYIDKVAFNNPSANLEKNPGNGNGSAAVLLIAMGVHSLLETVALGMAQDKIGTIMMAASIGLHQPAETIALLVSFVKTGMPTSDVIFYMSIFSVIGQCGVGLGMYIKGIASKVVEARVVAITAGTFIYMGATEMVNEEFGEHEMGTDNICICNLYKFLSIIAGVVTIVILTGYSKVWEEQATASENAITNANVSNNSNYKNNKKK
jgi:zinc transporter ZupT